VGGSADLYRESGVGEVGDGGWVGGGRSDNGPCPLPLPRPRHSLIKPIRTCQSASGGGEGAGAACPSAAHLRDYRHGNAHVTALAGSRDVCIANDLFKSPNKPADFSVKTPACALSR